MGIDKIREITDKALNDAWDKNDLLPNIHARMLEEIQKIIDECLNNETHESLKKCLDDYRTSNNKLKLNI